MRVAFGQTGDDLQDLSAWTDTKEAPSGRSYQAIKPSMRPQFLALLELMSITGEAEKYDGVEVYEVEMGTGPPASELVASNDAPVLAVVKGPSVQTLLLFADKIDQVLDVVDGLSVGDKEMAFLRDSERPSKVMPVVVGLTVAAAAVGGVMYLGRRR